VYFITENFIVFLFTLNFKGIEIMIKTITIDLINEKAMKLLQDMEQLQLIRVRREKADPDMINWSRLYKGAMSKQSLNDIENQLSELREGWE